MLTDPQSVTIGGATSSLPAVSRGSNTSTYQNGEGTVKLTVSHAYGKRNRRNIRLDFTKVAADPLVSAQSIQYSMSAYLVIDEPITGFTVTQAKEVVDGLLGFLTASSGAAVTAVLGGQS